MSMTRRDIAAMSRRFGNGAPVPLPVPPVPAPADVAQAPADAQQAPSGTRYVILSTGSSSGDRHPWDDVDLRYTIWDRHGMAATSRAFGSEDAVPYAAEELPSEWAEELAQLHEGGRARFWYTSGLAPEPHLADVTVIQVHPRPQPPPVPADVARPPAAARHTSDGTAYVVLGRGAPGRSPSANDPVSLVVTAWTNVGTRFYSSLGAPLVLPMAQLPLGMSEAMQQLTGGARARFWIPADVGRARLQTRIPRWPLDGTAVLDVDLVAVVQQTASGSAP
jgi:peptidylprolyl isomerase